MDFTVGVMLEDTSGPDIEEDDDQTDQTGHTPASGYRGRHRMGNRAVRVGEDVLRAASEAVGREVALVVAGVVGGIDKRLSTQGNEVVDTGTFDIGDMELKFGVKAVFGTGKAIEALLTASGEATVEVTLKLRRRA
jgi:hypothetical protein